MDEINILGIKIAVSDIDCICDELKNIMESVQNKSRYVCATSVHGVIESQFDSYFKHILNNAFLNLPDGLPLVWAGYLLSGKRFQQIKGYELILKVCEVTSNMDIRHYFYGGNAGVSVQLANNLMNRFPGLKVAGTFSPPYRPLEEGEKKIIVDMINNSETNIVWVGLSTPKQEKWMYELLPKLKSKILFSVGAAFDFHTGRIKFAPYWMQKIGLEWLYRLLTEPRRLYKRYLKIVPLFIYYFILQYIGLKKYEIDNNTSQIKY